MREKLLDLMKNEGLKPSQLAEMLEINPAGISHILAGRNKPGFDLLQKILRRFPQINPDWLMLDSSKMYRDNYEKTKQQELISVDPLKAPTTPDSIRTESSNGRTTSDLFSIAPPQSGQPQPERTMAADISKNKPADNRIQITAPQVTRVVVFYDDQTFETYSPAQH